MNRQSHAYSSPRRHGTEAASIDDLVDRVRARMDLPSPAERRRIRKAAGISLRDVAAACGVSHTAVATWERGATPRDSRAAYGRLLGELRRLAPPEGSEQ